VARLAWLFENSRDAIVVCSLIGEILDWSQGAENLFGYAAAEMIGKSLSVLFNQDCPDLNRILAQLGDETFRLDDKWACRRKNGVPALMSFSACPIRDSQNRCIGLMMILRNAGESEKPGNELLAGNQLRSLADDCPAIMWATGPDGSVQYGNRAYQEFFGINADEVTSIAWTELIYSFDLEEYLQKLSDSVRDQAPFSAEARTRRADGELRWIGSRAQPRCSETGEFLGYIGLTADITDRRRAEEERQLTEARLCAITDSAREAIIMMDSSGAVSFWNPAAEQIFGYSKDEAIGKVLHSLIAPVNAAQPSNRCIEHFVMTGNGAALGATIERIACRKDGQEIPVELSISCAVLNGERQAIGIVRDCSDRKRIEEELKNSEQQFRQLAECIREVFWIMNTEGDRLLYISPAYEQVWGRPGAELFRDPMAWSNAVHPADRERVLLTAQRQMRGEDVVSEFRIHTPEGKTKWIQARTFPVTDVDGRMLRVVGLAVDITDPKVIEADLKEANDRFNLAARIGEVGIWDWDPVHSRMIWVEQMLRLHGIARDQFDGTEETWKRCLHPDDRERAMRECLDALEGRGEFDTEFRVIRGDGSVHSIRAIGLVQRDASGRAFRMIGTNWDITAQRQVAEELRVSNVQLQQAIVRSEELAAAADRANSVKSDFLANMSHEIRTPLNGIIGMTELLLTSDLSDEQRHCAEVLGKSGKSLLVLINDILDLSKIEAKKLELETAAFDLCDLLDDVISHFAIQANSKRLGLVSIIQPGTPCCLWGDPGRLRQILVNLVGNGIKFTGEGEVVVEVSLIERVGHDVLLHFSVTDTGIGVPSDYREFLFEKFTQMDSSTTRRFGGTGLGLAISKQLAQMMGGQIGVNSQKGRGAEFWFTARLSEDEIASAALRMQIPSDLQRTRMLIIGVSQSLRVSLATMGAAWGLRTTIAESVHEGLAQLYEGLAISDPFHVVVLDAELPRLDRNSLLKELRSIDDLRILHLDPSDVVLDDSAEESHSDARVQKPVRRNMFLDAIKRALRDEDPGTRNESRVGDARNREALPRARLAVGRDVRVLLVEDNVTNQQVAIGILAKFGVNADVASDGEQAMHALEAARYDLVLMDVRMPVMDGIAATRCIRDPESNVLDHDMPIIALTASALTSERDACLAAGMNGFLSKPFTPSELFDACREFLEENVTVVRILGSYTWTQARLHSHGNATVQPSGGQDWSTPRNTFDIRGHWHASRNWGVDATFSGNSNVPSSLPIPIEIVPGHTRVDLGLTRSIGERVEFVTGATNLLRARHEEFYPEDYTLSSYIPRSIYIGLTWAR